MPNPVDLAIESHLASFNQSELNAAQEDPFFVMDLGEVIRQHRRWRRHLPNVHPFYGMLRLRSLESLADCFLL